METLVLATRNPGKVREIKARLDGIPYEVRSLADYSDLPEVAETGKTFKENALLKALAVASATGCLALADDSGLEVDALDGDPGVYSARFCGEGVSDLTRCRTILSLLHDLPEEKRGARFFAAIVVAAPDGTTWWAEATCQGRIATEMSGTGGFGFDPIFFLPERGLTMAQLPLEEKNRVSARSKGVLLARDYLVWRASNDVKGVS